MKDKHGIDGFVFGKHKESRRRGGQVDYLEYR